MADPNDIFSPYESAPALSADVEQELAGRILVKLAAEEGIDLESLTETDLKDLADQLRGAGSSIPSTEHQKEASAIMNEQQISEAEIDALITQETFKVAAAEGVDASALSVQDFAALKSAVFEMISEDPDGYFEKQAALEAFAAEEERSDYMGRKMAHAFYAELQQLQGGEVEVDDEGEKIAGRFSGPGRFDGVRKGMSDAMVRVGRGVEKHTGIGRKGAKEILDMGTEAGKGDTVSKGIRDAAVRRELAEHYGKVGRRATGAAAGTVGALGAAGAAAAHQRNKESAEGAILEAARSLLIANGYDPETGTKVAGLEAVSPELEAAALEYLDELGYPVR